MAHSVVCTLSEGHYHYGVAALCNSLHRGGFRGEFWFGSRGERPGWLTQGKEVKKDHFDFDGLVVVFVEVTTTIHLTSYKPQFIDRVFQEVPGAERVFYFDPDIVCQANWPFFEDWADEGVALCQDVCYPRFPANHPIRARWRRLSQQLGMTLASSSEAYFNGGFIGLSRANRGFLSLWTGLIEAMGRTGVDLSTLKSVSREDPFQTRDQDALNIAAMSADYSLSTIGPEAMGFIPAGYIMQHAVDSPKPWRKRYLVHFIKTGERPGEAHREYWLNVHGPIRTHSAFKLKLKKSEMLIVSIAGRFYRR